MSVIKVKIQQDYTVLHNVVLEDPRISFKAKGLWAYCMSRPHDWEFNVSHLATVSTDGIDAVYSALKELISIGLVERIQPNKGKFESMDYIIYPYPQDFKKCLPHRDFPQAGSSQAENPALLSKEVNNKERKEEQVRSPVASLPPLKSPFLPKKKKKEPEAKIERAPFVHITETQHKDLIKRSGGDETKVARWYDELSAWKIGKGIKEKNNDYRAILNWVILAAEEKDQKWKTNKSQNKSTNSKQDSSAPVTRELQLVTLSSIMEMQSECPSG